MVGAKIGPARSGQEVRVSERVVNGFVVSPVGLWKLVGSGADPEELVAGVGNEYGDFENFDEELSDEGYEVTMVDCARHVVTGELDPELSYPYARLVEPLLTAVAEPMGAYIQLAATYYLPNDSFKRWPPVLEPIGLPALAAAWGQPNFTFPWPPDAQPAEDWPTVTEISAATLPVIAAELAGDWRTCLAALPDDVLAAADRLDWAADARQELDDGLTRLANWVTRAAGPWESTRRGVAATGNSLILIMDGDR
jgi:hypothetical protein